MSRPPKGTPAKIPCSGKKRNGEPCRKWAIHGGTVCDTHGGSAKQVKAAAERRMVRAEVILELEQLGHSRDVDPGVAIVELVREAAGNVEFYRRLVQGLNGNLTQTNYGPGKSANEARHVLVELYDAERDRLDRYSTNAIRVGVEVRRLEMEEAEARRIFGRFQEALSSVGLTPTQQEAVRREFASALRAGQSLS